MSAKLPHPVPYLTAAQSSRHDLALAGSSNHGNVVHHPNGMIAGAGVTYVAPHLYASRVMHLTGRAVQRTPLGERRARATGKADATTSHALGGRKEEAVDPVTGTTLAREVSQVLKFLKEEGDEARQPRSLDDLLKEKNLLPLQRLHVLFSAAARLDREGFAPPALARARQALSAAIQDIRAANRHDIRRAVLDPARLKRAMEEIAGPIDQLKTVMKRELRNWPVGDGPRIGADRIDVPLDALSVLTFVKTSFGPQGCGECLRALRGVFKMQEGMNAKTRQVPGRNVARHWLAVEDAKAFNLAQSVLACAEELRAQVAGVTRAAPALPAGEIALLLLSTASHGWGSGRGEGLVRKVVDPSALDGPAMRTVHRLVRQGLASLPDAAWGWQQGARVNLLDELRNEERGLQPRMPRHETREERMERQWMDALRSSPPLTACAR